MYTSLCKINFFQHILPIFCESSLWWKPIIVSQLWCCHGAVTHQTIISSIVDQKSCRHMALSENNPLFRLWKRILHLWGCGLVVPCNIRHFGQRWFEKWLPASKTQSLYLNQCRLIDNWSLADKRQWHSTQDTNICSNKYISECRLYGYLSESPKALTRVVG